MNQIHHPSRRNISLFLVVLFTFITLCSAIPAALFSAVTTMAASSGTCHITYNKREQVFYDGWGTFRFDVTDQNGEHQLGYCIEPRLDSPTGNYTYEVYGDSADEPDVELFKTILMVSPGGPYNEKHGPGSFSSLDPDRQYGLGHAMLGLLYCNDRTGLSDGDYEFLKERLDYFRRMQNQLVPASERAEYNVYIVRTGSNSTQNIMWLSKKETGKANLIKQSANTSVTEGHSLYSLNDALYNVYYDETCTKGAASFRTNAGGQSQTIELSPGTYFVKEVTAPHGYRLDQTVYSLKVESGKTTTLTVTDQPLVDTTGLSIEKTDLQTGSFPQGGASLSQAEFRLCFYDAWYDSLDALPAIPTRTWIFETKTIDENNLYQAVTRLDEAYQISGDSLYLMDDNAVLPLGTLTIEEIKAPEGYLLHPSSIIANETERTADGRFLTKITGEATSGNTVVDAGHRYTISNQVIRGDFALTKIISQTQDNLSNVSFSITSNTTGESHTFTTDENGHYDSSSDWNLHSANTNGGGKNDGLWFGLTADGEQVAVDDTLGALPFDTYTIEELPSEENFGMQMLSLSLTVYRNGYTIDLNNVENSPISIQTTASDDFDGDHLLSPEEHVSITDHVIYSGLTTKSTYTLSGQLIDTETGDVLAENSTAFTPTETDGSIDLTFILDASDCPGKSLVVFESIYLDDIKIASHEDPDDENQTVSVLPRIRTKAVNSADETKEIACSQSAAITDYVSYEGLVPGETYTMKGEIRSYSTLETLGTAEVDFTPDDKNGLVPVSFSFDATSVAGEAVVVYETLLYNNSELLRHEDPENKEQTVSVSPRIQTLATTGANGNKLLDPSKQVTVTDTILYEGLIPGTVYTINGSLIQKTTNDTIASSSITFTPEERSGSTSVAFTLDATALVGEELVVFESLLLDEEVIAVHEDLENSDQTVMVRPTLKTKATDPLDGDQILPVQKETAVTDTVSYQGLKPDQEYKICGTLVSKENLESLVTAEKTFIPETSDGEVSLFFTFDTSLLAGKKVVAFEKLYQNDLELAIHADISDVDQTVTIEMPNETTQKHSSSPVTGDNESVLGWILLFGSMLFLMVPLFYHLKKNKNK